MGHTLSSLFTLKAGIAPLCVILIVLVAFAVGARVTPTRYEQQEQAQGEQLQVELITLTPRGFEPSAFARRQGRFFLAVDNRSGGTEMNLRLDRLTGERLREVRVSKELHDWSELVELHPGEYVLSEAEHPEWTCRITVTPR